MAHFNHRTLLPRITTGLLISVLTSNSTIAATQAAATQGTRTLQRAEDTPTRVRVRLTLKNGSKVAGTLVDASIDAMTLEHSTMEQGFVTIPRGGTLDDRITFQRAEVSAIEALTRRYRTAGSPADAEVVRYLITGFGIGKRVTVRTANRRFGGRIQSIQDDSFTVVRGNPSMSQRLAYGDVREVNAPRMGTAAKIAVWSGVAFGAAMGLVWLSWYTCRCD